MKNEFYSRKTEKKALDVGLAVRLEEPMMMKTLSSQDMYPVISDAIELNVNGHWYGCRSFSNV
jgi:hypothetical protein